MSAPVFGQPNLLGYVFNQVGLGRTELEEEVIPGIFTRQSEALMHHIPREGGRLEQVDPSKYENTTLDLMAIGKYVISHES